MCGEAILERVKTAGKLDMKPFLVYDHSQIPGRLIESLGRSWTIVIAFCMQSRLLSNMPLAP